MLEKILSSYIVPNTTFCRRYIKDDIKMTNMSGYVTNEVIHQDLNVQEEVKIDSEKYSEWRKNAPSNVFVKDFMETMCRVQVKIQSAFSRHYRTISDWLSKKKPNLNEVDYLTKNELTWILIYYLIGLITLQDTMDFFDNECCILIYFDGIFVSRIYHQSNTWGCG